MLLTWRFRYAVRRPAGDPMTAYAAEPATRKPQTPIARLNQTSTTSIPTFS